MIMIHTFESRQLIFIRVKTKERPVCFVKRMKIIRFIIEDNIGYTVWLPVIHLIHAQSLCYWACRIQQTWIGSKRHLTENRVGFPGSQRLQTPLQESNLPEICSNAHQPGGIDLLYTYHITSNLLLLSREIKFLGFNKHVFFIYVSTYNTYNYLCICYWTNCDFTLLQH